MVQKFRLELGHEVGLFVPAFLIGVAFVECGDAEVRVQTDTALSEVPNLAFQVLTVTQSLGPLQRQREVEAYALQGQSGMVESLLARHC